MLYAHRYDYLTYKTVKFTCHKQYVDMEDCSDFTGQMPEDRQKAGEMRAVRKFDLTLWLLRGLTAHWLDSQYVNDG